MADDAIIRRRDHVAENQPFEVERLVSRYHVSKPLVLEVIRRHGPVRTDVEQALLAMRPASER